MTFNKHDIEPYIPRVAEAIRLDFAAHKDRLTPEMVERIIYFRLLKYLVMGIGRGGESECPSCHCPTKFGHAADCEIVRELDRLSCSECKGEGCAMCSERGLGGCVL